MDEVVIPIAVLSLVAIAAIGGIGLRRWIRNGYRFRLKTLLHLTIVASVLAYVAVEFILPRMQHQWAVHVVRQSRGNFYRVEEKGDSIELVDSDGPRSDAEDIEIVKFDHDYEVASSANVLKYLPELHGVEFSLGVKDKGITSVLESQENTGLMHLAFECPYMTDASLESIGRLHSLESIIFVSSGITDQGLMQLNDLKRLKFLHLYEDFWNNSGKGINRNRFGPPGYDAIAHMRGLIYLSFKGYVVTDECARCLHDAASLDRLDFESCVISKEALTNLRRALPVCKIIADDCVEPGASKPDGWYPP